MCDKLQEMLHAGWIAARLWPPRSTSTPFPLEVALYYPAPAAPASPQSAGGIKDHLPIGCLKRARADWRLANGNLELVQP
jgi:hypothetical protein